MAREIPDFVLEELISIEKKLEEASKEKILKITKDVFYDKDTFIENFDKIIELAKKTPNIWFCTRDHPLKGYPKRVPEEMDCSRSARRNPCSECVFYQYGFKGILKAFSKDFYNESFRGIYMSSVFSDILEKILSRLIYIKTEEAVEEYSKILIKKGLIEGIPCSKEVENIIKTFEFRNINTQFNSMFKAIQDKKSFFRDNEEEAYQILVDRYEIL